MVSARSANASGDVSIVTISSESTQNWVGSGSASNEVYAVAVSYHLAARTSI